MREPERALTDLVDLPRAAAAFRLPYTPAAGPAVFAGPLSRPRTCRRGRLVAEAARARFGTGPGHRRNRAATFGGYRW